MRARHARRLRPAFAGDDVGSFARKTAALVSSRCAPTCNSARRRRRAQPAHPALRLFIERAQRIDLSHSIRSLPGSTFIASSAIPMGARSLDSTTSGEIGTPRDGDLGEWAASVLVVTYLINSSNEA